ncbi:polyprenyl synthetase family protein [Streptomyces sp. N2-109]|uniref:Polyprenyl synthetase family protein n=1 Tax=Streptomyces gossypii TaxID=2883101 RepID=A0ABT2JZE9_9ACTN|nr:polyprenyl synthetase family protein [Streptomyces gossypii]MCT2593282.1 polyprenyl synthetase family protein [Streptomyces gossypii]
MSVLAEELAEGRVGLRAQIDGRLDSFLRGRLDAESNPEARQALQLLHTFALRGGKRVRPLFCYWGWRGAGGEAGDPEVLGAAAALELFHTAALIHDDIIDESDLRRGRATMHMSMGQLHASEWRGEQRRFGLCSALLAGNACLVWSEDLFQESPLVVRSARARALFGRLRSSAVYGEFLDLVGEARDSTMDEALKIVRHKTASYTVRYPLQIGGALAGADEELLAAYDRFGLLIGEAFQLRDDLVGFLGTAGVSGKAAADDARKGKPTALIAAARELADNGQRDCLDHLYGAPWIGDAEVARLRETVEKTGAPAVIERMIHERHDGALSQLREASLHPTARAELELLATASLNRDS